MLGVTVIVSGQGLHSWSLFDFFLCLCSLVLGVGHHVHPLLLSILHSLLGAPVHPLNSALGGYLAYCFAFVIGERVAFGNVRSVALGLWRWGQ